jgi:hypothetical protein
MIITKLTDSTSIYQPSEITYSRWSILSNISSGVRGSLNWVWTHTKVPLFAQLITGNAMASIDKPVAIDQQHQSAAATPRCLEQCFTAQAFELVNVNAPVNFVTFLKPNECNVIKVKEHLDLQENIGPIVSTGTERSFFDLALCNPAKCTGLIVRDINPKVKAYVDFNTLLLRLSNDVNEYAQLSDDLMSLADLKKWVEESELPSDDIEYFLKNPLSIDQLLYDNPSLKRKKNEILLTRTLYLRQRIEESNISPNVREYYLHHLNDFASIYFDTDKSWRGPEKDHFQGVQYHKNPEIFYKLQQFARSGNIIAILGDINDLHFLDMLVIGIVDVSNIPDYIIMNLLSNNFRFRVIWTYLHPGGNDTTYYSCTSPTTLLPEQREEFDQLLRELRQAQCIEKELPLFGGAPKLGIDLFFSLLHLRKEKSDMWLISYSVETLNQMKEFKEQWMLEIPSIGWISLDSTNFNPNRINAASIEGIKSVCKNPKTVRFLPQLIANWSIIDFDKFIAFSEIPGWKEAFFTEAEKLSKKSQAPWMNEAFQHKFGQFLCALNQSK